MKLWKIMFYMLIGCGFVILLGTAGSCDLGNISLVQVGIQIALAFTLLGVGALGARVIYVKERRRAIHRSQMRFNYVMQAENRVREGA